jgi:hypothetical protein
MGYNTHGTMRGTQKDETTNAAGKKKKHAVQP